MENFVITYGQKLALNSREKQKYLTHIKYSKHQQKNNSHIQQQIQQEQQQNQQSDLQCVGTHPIHKIKIDRKDRFNEEEFIIINSQNPDYTKGPVIFGSQVYLKNKEDEILVSSANGLLKMQKPSFDDTNQNSLLLKNAKWTIKDPNSDQNKSQICIFDEIVLQSIYGNYLVCEKNGSVSANGNNKSISATWRFCPADIPYMPTWVYLRQEQNSINSIPSIYNNNSAIKGAQSTNTSILSNVGGYSKQKVLVKKETQKLQQMNFQTQEMYLIEEILFAMMSIEGTYIKRKYNQLEQNQYEYELDPNAQCENSLRSLVNKLLPICTLNDRIQQFTQIHEGFQYGTISQAFCASIEQLLREFILMVNQLDSEFQKGKLTLQKLWFYIQPSYKILEYLDKLCTACKNARGSILIGKLYEMTNNQMDQQMVHISEFLIHSSFQPFLVIFQKWLYQGIIDDQYNEFIIKESHQKHEETWEDRFSLQEEIPQFLQKHSQLILKTGKYINVMKECDHERFQQCPFETTLIQNKDKYIQKQDFSEAILQANQWANHTILNLYIKEEDLFGKLASLKNYFFLETGDFFEHFMESAEEELIKPVKSISIQKLESLLELSLRTSSLSSNKYIDDMLCSLQSFTLHEQLYALQVINSGIKKDQQPNLSQNVYSMAQNIKGFEIFTLDYNVKWPLNIIISKKSMTKYQILFRHLFYCKYVERQLSNTWLLHQQYKQYNLQRKFLSSYCLMQRMIHFSKNLVYNMCYEILERNWQQFQQKLKSVNNFEDILEYHDQFLDNCMKECMLLEPNLLKIIQKLNDICRIFTQTLQLFFQHMKLNKGQNTNENIQPAKEDYLEFRMNNIRDNEEQLKKIVTQQSYQRVIDSFSKKFDQSLKELLNYLVNQLSKQDSHLVNLVTRLDYEGFYQNYLEMNQQDTLFTNLGNISNNNNNLSSNMDNNF